VGPILGLLAGVLTTGAWLPQVLRTLRTRETGDFAWAYLLTFGSGLACWNIYGVIRGDLPLILANAVSLLLLAAIITVKFRYDKWALARKERRQQTQCNLAAPRA
jgi:MtN3 and saliva related transmembrane protein